MGSKQLEGVFFDLFDLSVERLDYRHQTEGDAATGRTLGSGQTWSRLSETLEQGLRGDATGIAHRHQPGLEASG